MSPLFLPPSVSSLTHLITLPKPNHNMFSCGNNERELSLFYFPSFLFFFFVLLCIITFFSPVPRCCESWSLASNCYLFFFQLDATPYGSGESKMETVKINAFPPSHRPPNPPFLLTQPVTMTLIRSRCCVLCGSQAGLSLRSYLHLI